MDNLDINKDTIRNLLIKSVHSDKIAIEFFKANLNNKHLLQILKEIAIDDYSGDARMEASYYVSQFNNDLLYEIEKDLLILQKDELDSIACHAFIALAKIQSKEGLQYLIHNRIKPELHWEGTALEYYFKQLLANKD